MKKFLAGVASCLMVFMWSMPVAFSETTQEKCERLEREGEKLPPECMKIPLPENPNPVPQPSVKPTPAPEEEPPHEAWESPNAGGEDSGSGKPEKPVKEPKPAKEPTSSGSDSSSSGSGSAGSKKPSGSSSTGDKKPSGSSSDGGGVSSNGSGRPDTVCGGEFCNPEDTLIGGVGSINDRYPNRNPGQGADPADVPVNISPVDDNTPPEHVGTIVETEDGLAVETPDGLITLPPEEAQNHSAGEKVQVPRNSWAEIRSNNNKSSNNRADIYDEDPYWYLKTQDHRCKLSDRPLEPWPGGLSSQRQSAVDYAERYAENGNPKHLYFDGDCTNFASQVLDAGGLQQVGGPPATDTSGWWYLNPSDHVPPTSQIDNNPGPPIYSRTWTVTSDNYDFMINSGRGTAVQTIPMTSYDSFDPLAPSQAGLEPGDLIYYRKCDGTIDHLGVYVGQVRDSHGNPVDVVDQHSVAEGCAKHGPWTPNPKGHSFSDCDTGETCNCQASVTFVKVQY